MKHITGNYVNVFCDKHGQPFYKIDKAWGIAKRKSGIPSDFRFHDLRHTFASRLVMGGIDLTTVKELMGHSDISMTMRYSHLTPKHKRSAVEILDKRGEMDTYESQKVVAFTQGSSESL